MLSSTLSANQSTGLSRHSLTRIHTLPNELLREIFEHAAGLCTEKLELNRALLPALLQTCTIWRASAYATPRLWSFLYFAYKVTRGADGQDALHCTLHSLPNHLRYSQVFELRVEIYIEPETEAYVLPSGRDHLQSALDTLALYLLPHAHRCTAVDIREEGPRHLSMFVPPPAMVNLRRLKLTTTCRRSPPEYFPASLCGNIPPLEQSDKPLFGQPAYKLDTLDFDIVNRHVALPNETLTFIALKYASSLAGLRRFKINVASLRVTDTWRLDFHDLKVLALIGSNNTFHHNVDIVAPKLLYVTFTPMSSRPWEAPWHFPDLVETDSNYDMSGASYTAFVGHHLPSLQTINVFLRTYTSINRAVDPSAAPHLRVLRAHREQSLAVGKMMPFGLVEVVLRVLEARQDVRFESEPGSDWSIQELSSVVPDDVRTRLQDVAGRWVETRAPSIVERFFEAC